MTRKLFWEDSYLTHTRTEVTYVNGECVRVASTVFFAFSGGQESDSGTIGGFRVEEARKDGLEIVYRLSPNHNLNVGEKVEIMIDWPRRYRLMRLHFAAEMILQLVYKYVPGIVRIGAHISEDKARIDFAHDSSLATLLPQLLGDADDLVKADRAIITAYSDIATQRRYWHVEGFARMACGGTHPRSTGEVGAISLKRRNPGKGKERIEIGVA